MTSFDLLLKYIKIYNYILKVIQCEEMIEDDDEVLLISNRSLWLMHG